jgi:hypothetical protein
MNDIGGQVEIRICFQKVEKMLKQAFTMHITKTIFAGK